MSIPRVDLNMLWNLPWQEFNEWRANNDLPMLYEYFSNKLPGFIDWSKENSIDSSTFSHTVNTGLLFVGERNALLVKNEVERTPYHSFSVSKISKEELETRYKEQNQSIPETRLFVPYFLWARKTLGDKRYIISDELNHGTTDTFEYNLWSGVDRPEVSRASLFKDFEVLKLGGVILYDRAEIGGRNLDFVDLDHLTIEGDWHGSRQTCVYFSSCLEITINNANVYFLRFYKCPMRKLSIRNSKVQDMHFIDSDLSEARFENTRLFKVSFEECAVFFDFDKCELQEFKYVPKKKAPASSIADSYRRLRTAYQNAGKRHEASECYYLERKHERRSWLNPYIGNRSLFPPMRYAGTLLNVIEQWRRKKFSAKDSLKHLAYIVLFHLKVWFIPKYALRAIRFKLKYSIALVEEMTWGYGERPIRIVLQRYSF